MPPASDPPIVTGFFAIVLLTAALASMPISFALLYLYRRRVLQAMRQVSHAAADEDEVQGFAVTSPPVAVTSPPVAAASSRPLEVHVVGPQRPPELPPEGTALLWWAQRGPWITTLVYAAAGLAYAVAMTTIYLQRVDTPSNLVRWAILIWVFAWPIVLTVSLLHQNGIAYTVRFVAGYIAVLLALATSQGSAWYMVVVLWLLMATPPTLYQIIFLQRKLRAVGPLVIIFLIVAITGAYLLRLLAGTRVAIQFLVPMMVQWQLDANTVLLALGGVGLVLFALPGWLSLAWLARQYEARRVSDQSLAVDALWLVFAIDAGLDLANEGPGYALAGLGCFVVFKIIATLGFALVARRTRGRLPHRLLLLRVFGSQARSERLMDRVGSRWRYAGTIQLIAGTDLATQILEPHDLLDLVRGRLRQRYVASRAMLERRLAGLNPRSDLDGRFRLTEFFCYDNTWRFTLSALAANADAVLMDLRGFSPSNQGCVFELRELVQRVPLERVVLLVDQTTDRAFLHGVLQRAAELISPDSPNRYAASLHVLACDLSQEGAESVHLVLRSLARAVLAPPRTLAGLAT